MRSFWLDPYLWVHLAGAAVVPIALEGCLLGLAASNSLLPPWMELLLVGIVGVAPILWMQWQRPFCIYSLMFLALQPHKLTEEQRRILRRFQSPVGKGLSLVTAGVLLAALWQIYQIAPIAWESASIVPGGALGGLLLASISFLFANLFLQVPVSVAQVMLTDERTIAATEPYPVNAVAKDFTLLGIRVNQILPSLNAEPALATAAASPQTADRKGDRPTKTTPSRSKAPQPSPSNPQTPAEAAANPAGQPAQKPKRPGVPVKVIDAEFRELGSDDEWNEVIVSEEESLTENLRPETATEVETPAVEVIQTETPHPDRSERTLVEADNSEFVSAETIAPTAARTKANIAAAIAIDTEQTAVSETETSETETPTDLEIAPNPIASNFDKSDKLDSENSDSAAGTIAASSEANVPEPTDKLAEPLWSPSPETPPSAEPIASPKIPEPTAITAPEELLQPIPEPLEELLHQTRFTGEEDLLISAMTLIESEDVNEAAAVDVPAVEVVTAEIVEDVSEDAAVPAETIETWLEEDWEEEVTG